MDENYEKQFRKLADPLLEELRGRAAEAGDECQKHDAYIGYPDGCPWCEIDELTITLKGKIGDLKPSVVMKWPRPARRAVVARGVQIVGLQEEIERLREDRNSWKQTSEGLEMVLRESRAEKDKLDARIEELERRNEDLVASRKRLVNICKKERDKRIDAELDAEELENDRHGAWATIHPSMVAITHDQIKAAWRSANQYTAEGVANRECRHSALLALAKLGIKRCEGCADCDDAYGEILVERLGGGVKRCNGHGFIVETKDDCS